MLRLIVPREHRRITAWLFAASVLIVGALAALASLATQEN